MKPATVALAAVALGLIIAPAASAAHHVGPPDWTGLGGGDVSDEPDHPDDDNGLDQQPLVPDGIEVLDGQYAWGSYPYFLAINTITEEATENTGAMEHEDRMYPGKGFLAAWWGWWFDKGSGQYLNEIDDGGVNPFVSDDADGVIQDGHDDHTQDTNADIDPTDPVETTENYPYTGPWDEFVWRGENPWADQAWGPPSQGKTSHPKDKMFAFINPGTYGNCCSGIEKQPTGGKEDGNQLYGGPYIDTGLSVGPFGVGAQTPGILLNSADHPHRPDIKMEDRTSQTAQSPPPVYPHNNIAYGWVEEVGYWHFEYDQSLFISTTVTYSVNPHEIANGLYDPTGDVLPEKEPTAVDRDTFSAVNPQLTSLYRQAVWDPGDEEDGPTDEFMHDEGPKQAAKDTYTAQAHSASTTVQELFNDATNPLNPILGPADDAQGARARAHEPDTGAETGYAAGHDPATAYGGTGQAYYRPGGNAYDPSDPNGPQAGDQTYEDYEVQREPWVDTQSHWAYPGYGVFVRVFAGENFFPTPTETDASERTAAPGLLYVDTHLGAWHDDNGDTFIGDLSEPGRTTAADEPYAQGRVDDPNDYSDTASTTASDPTKVPPAEWKGANCDSTVTTTLRPVGTPTSDADGDGDQEHAWGTTDPPVGVYVLRDDDSNRFNPYDEILEDAAGAGPGVADWGQDNTGEERFSRHVQYGPIEVTYQCSASGDVGLWEANENVLLPAGTAEYEIEVKTTGTLGELRDEVGLRDLQGMTITDVDVIG